jgi:hypothetical protein
VPGRPTPFHGIVIRTRTRPIPLRYRLAFLEFKEDGSPQILRYPSLKDGKLQIPWAPSTSTIIGQFDILEDYLGKRRQQSTYVVVFIHGWRHDARLGDSNVADLRHFAAHAARFLAERCETGEQKFCETEVVAVYLGWRGARVDEWRLNGWFGAAGEQIANLAAIPTLFDRKPVSEQVAAPALSAMLRMTDMLKIHRTFEATN